MSGMEVVAVVACVAGIVSAFQQGDVLVKKIREKRRSRHKGALPPKKLEDSLARGPLEIIQAKEDGTQQFGKAFEKGDRIARDALSQIEKEMYKRMLYHLIAAVDNDESLNDFNVLVEVSNLGRLKSVMALNELFMRMAQGAPIQTIQDWPDADGNHIYEHKALQLEHITSRRDAVTSPVSEREEDFHERFPTSPTTTSTNRDPNAAKSKNARRLPATSTSSYSPLPATHASTPQAIPSSPASPTFKKGWRQMLPIRSRNSSISSANQRQNSNSFEGFADTPLDRQNTPASSSIGSPESSFLNGHLDSVRETTKEEPWHIESMCPSPRPNVHDKASKIVKEKPSKAKKWSYSASTSPRADFGGFCKGACIMRTGNQGMNLRNQSTSMTGQSRYWACSKCAFEGGAIKGSRGWSFDEQVREAYGVRYRWKFLAKSHVAPTKKVVNRTYDYQCVLCSAQGEEPTIARGEKAFIEHVSHHRRDKHNPFGMQLIVAVFGRVALQEQESWDVNLLPLVSEVEDEVSELEASSPGLGIILDTNAHGNGRNGLSISESEFPLLSSPDSREDDYGGVRDRDGTSYSLMDDESLSVHPALRGSIAMPDPWRASYVTMQGGSLG